MNASDLRIGNLITYQEGGPDTKQEVVVDIPILKVIKNENKGWKRYQPINITEERLISLDFESITDFRFIKEIELGLYLEFIDVSGGLFPVLHQASEFASEPNNTMYLNKIEHLHELQNFWYLFSGGKELNK